MLDLSTYIDFKVGNLPLIVSVPHGGMLECDFIPKRSTGILGTDKGTIELAVELVEQICLKFERRELGKKLPFYIFSKLHRNRIDLNRDKFEAYNHNSFLARDIYMFYHNKIQDWVHTNLRKFNRCLLIDIHGFEKKDRPPGFRDVEIILGTNNLESFFPEPIPKKDWAKNIRGKFIQAILQLKIPIAPGHPRRREYILTGGYITKKYGASHISKSQAIQIEFSDVIRLYDENLRNTVLNTLSEILFMEFSNKK